MSRPDATERVAADVQPNRGTERLRVDLLGQVGHGDGRDPGQRDTLKGADGEEGGEAGAAAASSPSAAEAIRASCITRVRPHASDNHPAGRRARASVPVVRASVSIESAGLTPKSRARSGSRGWVA